MMCVKVLFERGKWEVYIQILQLLPDGYLI
jgi:hypothetical protein